MNNFFRRRRYLKSVNYLDMIPVRQIEHESSEFVVGSDKITLLVPKFRNEKLRMFLIPSSRSPYIRIRLDSMGSYVWTSIDGNSTVGEICLNLKERFGENGDYAEERVTKFLTRLFDNRLITYKQLQNM